MTENKKLWGGRFDASATSDLDQFWSSISFDQRLIEEDIAGSIAHAEMLSAQGILSELELRSIKEGLQSILSDHCAGKLEFRASDEDIHMNVERMLTERIGPVAGKLHTARSRNDQIALDMHLYIRKAAVSIGEELSLLCEVLLEKAKQHQDCVLPGYTHLQRAQPVLFSHHLLAYFWMFHRDSKRLESTLSLVESCPLGAGALAGSTFPIDREVTAAKLGFKGPYQNSIDAIANRDASIALLMDCSMIALHLSRFCEEIVLWGSSEFSFISLGDEFCSGSSMMPQKKNPDLAELIRAKTGRVYGNLMSLLTTMKGLPLSYNKDLQEDKEPLFDSVDTISKSLLHFREMLTTLEPSKEKMLQATKEGFLAATDIADYLAEKGMPFREAHSVVGRLVKTCLDRSIELQDLSLEEFHSFSEHFEDDIFECLEIKNVVNKRASYGGTAELAVQVQIAEATTALTSQVIRNEDRGFST